MANQVPPGSEYLERLKTGIDRRQEELGRTAQELAVYARRLALWSSVTKVSLVLLGAFSATKAVGDQLFGSGNTGSLAVYALAGMLTAAVAGLDAAFKWDRRSVGLGALAAKCLSQMRDIDTQYRGSVVINSIPEREQAAKKVLELQDASLKDVQAESTGLGANITFNLYPPSETTPPYPA